MSEKIKNQLELLKQKEKELGLLYRRIAIKFGISDNEFRVLYSIMISNKEHTQKSLSMMLLLPKQTLNSVISNLIKKRYLYLEVIRGTRNRKIIRLTDEGKEFGRNNVMLTYEAEQRAISKLSEFEIQTCLDILGKYTNLLREEFGSKLPCEA